MTTVLEFAKNRVKRQMVRSMEGRMQDVYRHYGIPANTPYGNVASGGGGSYVTGLEWHRKPERWR